MAIVFWASLALILYTYVGYPLIVWALSTFRRRAPIDYRGEPERSPLLSILLPSPGDCAATKERIENILESDYPHSKLQIIAVCDGWKDGDDAMELIDAFPNGLVTVLESGESIGKAASLDLASREATGDILVFAELHQEFTRNALENLAKPLRDPGIGAVTGTLEPRRDDKDAPRRIRFASRFWKWESNVDSCIGCAAGVYAMRKSLWNPIANDIILDDVVIPMRAVLAGQRVHFQESAIAHPTAGHIGGSRRRSIAGMFQILARYPGWMFPQVNRLWWQFVSHHAFRVLGPVFFEVLLFANVWLAFRHPFFIACLGVQLLCYTLALIGMMKPKIHWRPITMSANFLAHNIDACRGFFYFLRSGWRTA